MDAFQIHDTWMEEVELLKMEMSNFLQFYTDVRIPTIQQSIVNLVEKMSSLGQCKRLYPQNQEQLVQQKYVLVLLFQP